MTQRFTRLALCVLAVFLPAIACITVTNESGDDGRGGGRTFTTSLAITSPGASSSDTITVRLVNATATRAVDVQLFATGQGVGDLDTEFFIPANQLLADIGFAGSGILVPASDDQITLACADALIVGTLGGRFLNEDTGEEIGTGSRFVLFQGSQFACGSTITFTFSE
ncbi:MAG TPA: hypothetical protein PKG54_07580 [Phycisphaerae bacterium]|jgi:hypothetical protein|nr:hypothetical protein [Phycisphaerae bacterium]HOB74370.1 hypothetical protein [Phycisphaerae bacterium]HOJ54511.1 hypothetical protein [Phycisphaerae bacterium]HOL26540.1 hypothetical protein [Phycisphaerae bacterium]HPP20939.1 hypothetical protein [Phycisphaerae bacterium]